jgi:hypothetical protein
MSFLAPLFAFIVLPLVGAVFFFFKKKGREFIKVKVSSHQLFLQQAKSSSPKKLVFPPRVFLEAALLALLALGVMRASHSGEAKRIAVVLDVSQSMGAQNEGELPRIEIAKKAITSGFCTTCSSFFLFTAVQGDAHPADASTLGNITPSLEVDAIDDALSRFDLGAFDQVHVYTDKPLSLHSEYKNLYWHNLGSQLSNVSLLSASLLKGELSVHLRSYATGEFSGSVITSEGEAVAVRLSPNEDKEIKFQLRKKARHVAITLRADPQSVSFDRLASDNNVEVDDVLSGAEAHTLKLISEKSYTDLGLSLLSLYKEGGADASVDIYYKTALPSTLSLKAGKKYLFVAPPSSLWWQKLYEEEAIDYQVSSPILANLELVQMHLPSAISYNHEKWMFDVIRGVTGGILFAGEKNGARVVVIGADPFPLNGKDSPTAAILFLNILNWLEGKGGTAESSLDAQEGNLLEAKDVEFSPVDRGSDAITIWRKELAKSLTENIALVALGIFVIDLIVGLLLRVRRRAA